MRVPFISVQIYLSGLFFIFVFVQLIFLFVQNADVGTLGGDKRAKYL